MNNSENIDKLAQSFFIVLVFCSVASDSYIFVENLLKNNYVKKKVNYFKKIYKVIRGLTFNNYINDEEGNIVIDENIIENNENNKVAQEIEISDDIISVDEVIVDDDIITKDEIIKTDIEFNNDFFENEFKNESFDERYVQNKRDTLDSHEDSPDLTIEYPIEDTPEDSAKGIKIIKENENLKEEIIEIEKNPNESIEKIKSNNDTSLKTNIKKKKNLKKNIKEVIIKKNKSKK
jgi:hypothetical protein